MLGSLWLLAGWSVWGAFGGRPRGSGIACRGAGFCGQRWSLFGVGAVPPLWPLVAWFQRSQWEEEEGEEEGRLLLMLEEDGGQLRSFG